MFDFYKYQGLGNDFILIDERGTKGSDAAEWQSKTPSLCDRHLGIGADGLLILSDSEGADFEMTVVNADGSIPQMCGNGIRCAARHAYFIGSSNGQKSIKVKTGAGLLTCKNLVENDHYIGSKVAMGKPILTPSLVPTTLKSTEDKILQSPLRVKGRELEISLVSMGNPHCVVFVLSLIHI